MEIVVVVFPTPPFWIATAMILVGINCLLLQAKREPGSC
jgi:hypothetical protein